MTKLLRWASPAVLGVVFVIAPQIGGAVFRWCAPALGILVVLLLLLRLGPGANGATLRVNLLGWAFVGLAGWTCVQALPLPNDLADALNPAVFRLYSDARGLPGAFPGAFTPLTVDSSLTCTEALKWATYAALYLIVLNLPRGSGRMLGQLFVAAGILTAAVCLVESAFQVQGILGIYLPRAGVSSWLRGPFVNPAHSAIYCALLGTVILGLARESAGRARNWLRGLSVALLLLSLAPFTAKTTIACMSGPATYAFLRARANKARIVTGSFLWIWLGLGLSIVIVLLVALPSPSAIRAMPDQYNALRRFSRIVTWSDAVKLIGDFPLVGVGRGAFGPAFTPYDTVSLQSIAWHAEDIPIQMAAEWGLLPTFAFLAAVAANLIAILPSLRRPRSCALMSSLVMLALVGIVDFNLELLGMAATAVVCVGILNRRRSSTLPKRSGRVAMAVTTGLVGASLAQFISVGGHTLENDAEAIRDLARAGPTASELDGMGAAAAVRHPADYFLPQLVASEHLRLRTSLGLPWLNQALALRPRSAEAHYLTAIALHRAGRFGQALIEYAFAARLSPRLVPVVGDVVLRNSSIRSVALRDVGWAQRGDLPLLEYIASALVSVGEAEPRFRVDERILQLAPTSTLGLAVLRRELAPDAPADLVTRLDAATAVNATENDPGFLAAVASLRLRAGRPSAARELLWRAAQRVEGNRSVAQQLISFLLDEGKFQEARNDVDRLHEMGRLAAGDAEYLRGLILERAGNWEGALYSYLRAAQYRPDDVDALVATALAAHHRAQDTTAMAYALRAIRSEHSDPSIRQRLQPIIGH